MSKQKRKYNPNLLKEAPKLLPSKELINPDLPIIDKTELKQKSRPQSSSVLKEIQNKPASSKKQSSPKKRRKQKSPDPLILQKQFEDWKQTEEFRKWNELNEMRHEFPEITETTDDLTGKWQNFESKLFLFAKKFKIKTKLKDLKHEHVRSFFFAREDKENFKIDGVVAGVIKEHSDRAWHLRRKFVEIWKGLEEINEYDSNNFTAGRKKMTKNLQEFFKSLTSHIKQAHKEIYNEKLGEILRPLVNLLKTNFRFSVFEHNNNNAELREISDFKYKALVQRFCNDLQETQRIFYEVPDRSSDVEKENTYVLEKITANPYVSRIFDKLNIKNWEKKPVEFFYLSKLRHAFFLMRKHLIKLFANGIDFWKIPLSANTQFLEDAKKLVDYELICERLLGNELKKDQLNFLYDTISLIMETPGKDKMLNKEETFIKMAIPKLLIFKNIQIIRRILDERKKNKDKRNIERIQGGLFFQFSIDKINKEVSEPQENLEKSMLARDISEKSDENSDNIETYGRTWLLENYIEENYRSVLFEMAEDLRHINLSVQQDIQDLLITEGLNLSRQILEHRDQYKDEIKKAREFIEQLKIEDIKKDYLNNKRPPILWNDPDVWEEHHKYRSIAAPQECYKDQRIQLFLEKIDFLGEILSKTKLENIEDLIGRVIDVFKNEFNPKPEPKIVYLGLYNYMNNS